MAEIGGFNIGSDSLMMLSDESLDSVLCNTVKSWPKTSYELTVTKTGDHILWSIFHAVSDLIMAEINTDSAIRLFDPNHKHVTADMVCNWIDAYPKLKPAKAVSKGVHAQWGINISPALKALLGDHLRKPEYSYTFRVDYDLSGNAYDFYHGGSCWFSSYKSSRDWLAENGGGAIRIYDSNDHLCGRVWFIAWHNGAILFNSYGDGDFNHTSHWGKELADLLGLHASKIDFDFQCDQTPDWFINSYTGYYVGPIAYQYREIEAYIPLKTPVLWRYLRDGQTYCDVCDNWIDSDYVEWLDDLNIHACSDCRHTELVYAINADNDQAWYYRDRVEFVNYGGQDYLVDCECIQWCDDTESHHHVNDLIWGTDGTSHLISHRNHSWYICPSCHDIISLTTGLVQYRGIYRRNALVLDRCSSCESESPEFDI
jgi:hypothetical protein